MSTSDEEYIVIKRSWMLAGLAGVIMFVVGGVVGYLVATTTFQRGIDEASAAMQAAVAGLQGGSGTAAQPTELPTRLDNVSADDDPALGPDDAPIVIVEFSDFR
jgi:protein-disulfide isomerase